MTQKLLDENGEEVDVVKETETRVYEIHRTASFHIKLAEGVLDRFDKKLDKVKNDKDKDQLITEFVQSRMRKNKGYKVDDGDFEYSYKCLRGVLFEEE